MGVHQYCLEVIPRAFENRDTDELANIIQEDWVWTDDTPSLNLINRLRTLLPKDTSWDEVEEFESANEWGSDIRIWKEDGIVRSIVFRFAPCADSIDLLEQFLNAIAIEDYLLFTRESRSILEPELEIICKDMKCSRAYRFLSNPQEVIVEASEVVHELLEKRLTDKDE